MWQEIYNKNHKRVVKDTKTGEVRTIIEDQKHREMVKRGDLLQPVGKDEKEFFAKNPKYKKNWKGEIVDTELAKIKQKEIDKNRTEGERAEFEKRDKVHPNKIYT